MSEISKKLRKIELGAVSLQDVPVQGDKQNYQVAISLEQFNWLRWQVEDKQKLVEGLRTIRQVTESGSDSEIKLTAIGIECDSLLKELEVIE